MAKWLTVGTVLKKKTGDGVYVKIKKDISLKEGTVLQVQDPRETVDILLSKGVLTQEQADDRKAKIPSFIKFDLILPPPQDK